MALSDPQAVDIGAGSVSLPRTSTGNNESTYTSADGTVTLELSTSKGKRQRQVIRVDVTKITADPFIPAQNSEVSMSFYMVSDRPVAGFTNTEALNIFLGLAAQMKASTNAVAAAWLGGQS
jgi:hypothetical protein